MLRDNHFLYLLSSVIILVGKKRCFGVALSKWEKRISFCIRKGKQWSLVQGFIDSLWIACDEQNDLSLQKTTGQL